MLYPFQTKLLGGLLCALTALWWISDRHPPTPVNHCPVDNPHTFITAGTLTLHVEVAQTPKAIRCGLSGRAQLPRGEGMLFIHPTADRWSFWMHNTHMPLSLVFIGPQHQVVQAEQLHPQQKQNRVYSRNAIVYALEMHPDDFVQSGIKMGTLLTLGSVVSTQETPHP